jgi:HK97 family phage major capsid protein
MSNTNHADEQHTNERIIATGGAIKAVGSAGRVGGYLVRFRDQPGNQADNQSVNQKDLVGEYFSAKTFFGKEDGNGAYCLFHHSIPLRAGLEGLADRFFQPIKTQRDDLGIWAETVLDLADAYERMVYELVQAGKLSWSSGSVPHMVRKADDGHILQWPIVEGSLTPTPAMPEMTRVQAVRVAPPFDMNAYRVYRQENEQQGGWTMSREQNQGTGDRVQGIGDRVQGIGDRVQDAGDIPTPGQAAVMGMQDTQTRPTYQQGSVEQVRNDQPLVARLAALEQTIKAITDGPAIKAGGFVLPGDVSADMASEHEERYLKAYNAYVYTGDRSALRAAKAAMEVGTPSEGGYLVPTRYAQDLVVALKSSSILRQAGARVLQVAGTDAFKVPVMTHSTTLATLTAEEDAFTEAEPTVGEVPFEPYKYTKLSKVSDELLESSRVDVVQQILIPDAAYAFAAAENTAFVVGTGSDQPQGVTAGASLGVTATSATAVTADEIMDLYHSVSYLYRHNAVWLMKDATAKTIRQLKDDAGTYLWQPGLQAGHPDTLLGRPIYTVETMPAMTTGNRAIVFGDLNYFWIVDFSHLVMTRLSELYAANGQVGFRWFHRIDSRVVLSEAIKYLVMA